MTTCLERQTKTGGRAVVLPLVRVSRLVPLCYIATANRVRPPHRTENEACCVWKSAAVKQPSVRRFYLKLNVSILRQMRLFRRCGKKPLVRV